MILLDLANEDCPPPLNLLAHVPQVERGNVAGRLMAVLTTLYDDFKDAQTVPDTLWSALVTLLYDDTPTVRDIARLFHDPVYRTGLLTKLDNEAALEFWERYELLSHAQQEQLVRPLLWRMRAFYGNAVLYPMLCHPDTLDFPTLIAQHKILLISLKADEARIPAREQQLIGMAVLSQLQQAVMGRAAGSTPYYLYVDEVQHFVTTSLETLFAEARKFGLTLTLANQYLKQLAGTLLDALLGNIGALIVFQCGLDDAKALAPYFAPGFDAERLINLNKYEAAVKLRFHEETQPAFSLHTLPPLLRTPIPPQAIAREHQLRYLSMQHYTPKSRADVLAWLHARYPAGPQRLTPRGETTVVDFD